MSSTPIKYLTHSGVFVVEGEVSLGGGCGSAGDGGFSGGGNGSSVEGGFCYVVKAPETVVNQE